MGAPSPLVLLLLLLLREGERGRWEARRGEASPPLKRAERNGVWEARTSRRPETGLAIDRVDGDSG